MTLQTYKKQTQIANAPTMAANAVINSGNATISALRQFQNTASAIVNQGKQNNALAKEAKQQQAIKIGNQSGIAALAKGDLTLRDDESPESIAFNQVVRKGYKASTQNDLKVQLEQISLDAPDPEQYRNAAEAAIAGAVGSVGDEETAAELRLYGERLSTQAYISANREASKMALQEAAAETVTNINTKMIDSLNFAREGDLDQAEQLQLNVMTDIDDAQEAGYITPAKASQFKQVFGERNIEQVTEGQFERLLDEDPEEAAKFLSELKNARLQGVEPERQDRLFDSLQSDLNARNREIRAGEKELAKQSAAADMQTAQTIKVATAADSGVPLDYKDKDDKAAANFVYNNNYEQTDLSDPAVRTSQIQFVKQIGVVPDEMKSTIRSGLYSNDPEVIAASADMMDRLTNEFAQATNQFTKQDISYAQRINRLQQSGVPVEEAVQIHKEFLKRPLAERSKEILQNFTTDELREMSQTAVNDWVDDKFDTLFTAEPEIAPQMATDYRILFDEFVGLTGDTEEASTLALKYMGNTWGVSEISGDRKMVKYPPEKILAGVEGEVDWITNDWNETQDSLRDIYTGTIGKDLRNQLKSSVDSENQRNRQAIQSGLRSGEAGVTDIVASRSDIEASLAKREAITFELQADGRTQRESPPTWRVFIKRENGYPEPALNDDGSQFRWTVNYKETKEYKAEQKLKAQKIKRAQELEQWGKELEASATFDNPGDYNPFQPKI